MLKRTLTTADRFHNCTNPAEFTCAHSNSHELKDAIPEEIYQTINEKTAVTKWAGERMDMSMAIDGLLSKSKKMKH